MFTTPTPTPTPSVSTTRKHLVKAAALLAIAAGTSALTGGIARADGFTVEPVTPPPGAPAGDSTTAPPPLTLTTTSFGHVLVGEKGWQNIHLVNTSGQPILL